MRGTETTLTFKPTLGTQIQLNHTYEDVQAANYTQEYYYTTPWNMVNLMKARPTCPLASISRAGSAGRVSTMSDLQSKKAVIFVPDQAKVDLRLGWRPVKDVEIYALGANLDHAFRTEIPGRPDRGPVLFRRHQHRLRGITQKMKRLALILAWGLASASAHATGVVAVLSGDAAPYKEALGRLEGRGRRRGLPPRCRRCGPWPAPGWWSPSAARRLLRSPTLSSLALVASAYCRTPKLKPKHGGNVTRVGLLPDAAVLIAEAQGAGSGRQRPLAAFDVDNSYSEYLTALKAAGAAGGVAVTVKKIESLTDLVGKLPAMKGSVQALWLPPDPLIMNPKTFWLLGAFCSAAKIALIAPVAALARAGAFAGISPSFNAVGEAAGKAAQAYSDGSSPGALIYPAHIETVLHTDVAAAIGVGASAKSKADSVVP